MVFKESISNHFQGIFLGKFKSSYKLLMNVPFKRVRNILFNESVFASFELVLEPAE